ncbi:MAG: DotA/TraY family protein, partial [Pseudomonadota bacterium]|nr:DotA/TraY family protein [Pseudomonadota bacterium]
MKTVNLELLKPTPYGYDTLKVIAVLVMKELRIFKRCAFLLPLVLLLIPALSFAAQHDNTEIFDLPITDPSHIFLGQLFGTVGSVLHGTGSNVFGVLFRYFNLGIIVISGVFVLWTTVKLIISSSSEGSFMGRGGQGAFHVLRTVSGIGLMVPTAGGYSVIQIVVMFFVLQGAGLANTVWDKVLASFEDGNQLMVPPSTNLAAVTDLSGTVLMAQVCMYYHEKLEHALHEDAKKVEHYGIADEHANLFSSYRPTFDSKNHIVNFPSARGNDPHDAGCGQISWYQEKNPQHNDYVESALRAVITTTAPAARNIANPNRSDISHAVRDDATDKDEVITVLDRHVQTQIVGANADWSNILLPVRAKETPDKLNANFYKNARKQGWLYAGSYYYELSKVQRDLMDAMDIKVKVSKPIMCIGATGMGELIKFPDLGINQECVDKENLAYANGKTQPDFSTIYKSTASYTLHAKKLAKDVQEANTDVISPKIELQDAGIVAPLLTPKKETLENVLSMFAKSGGDPIMKLQTMGNWMMGLIAVVWLAGSVIVFALSAGFSIMSS